MAVRRLAEEHLQPKAFAFTPRISRGRSTRSKNIPKAASSRQ